MQHLVKCFHRSLSSRFIFYVLVFSCKILMQYPKMRIKMCGWKSSHCFKLLVTTETLCEKMHLKERMMAFNWQQYSQASVFLLNVIFFFRRKAILSGKIILDIHKCAFFSHILLCHSLCAKVQMNHNLTNNKLWEQCI